MKKSSRPWVAAFSVSLLPLAYLAGEALGLVTSPGGPYDFLALAIGLLCTVPIWGAAFMRLRQHKHQQDLLSLVAILVSYGYSLVSSDRQYWWQSVALTSIVLLGGCILHAQLIKLSTSVKDLRSLVPAKASLIDGRDIEHVDSAALEIGEVVLVKPGTVVPADGYVIQGQSLVSQTPITGEADPMMKSPGDWVLAGSENLPGRGAEHGPLTVRVSAVGDDLLVNELGKSIDLENSGPARYTRFGQIVAIALTLLTIAGSLVAAGISLLLNQGIAAEFSAAISVLVAAQVATIALAAPLAAKASSIKAAALSVLVRNRKSFEALAKINHVVFNKTGTLTRGHNSVGAIHLARNTSIGTEDELLALAASVEMGTSHELGHLIIQEAAKRGLELPYVSETAPIPGLGVSARFDGSLAQVGNAGMVNVSGINMNPYDLFRVSSAYQEGSSVVFVSIDELLVGYIEFPDQIRPTAQSSIVELSGKHAITILSGDATGVVERVATSLGLTEFAAEVLSTRKADWVKQHRASGSRLLLIADGHYDAAALAEADVALAFGAGHSVHWDSADLILVSQDPLAVARLVALSRKTQRRTLANIITALLASLGLMVAGVFGVMAPLIALVSLVISWLLNRSLVRLVK